MHVHLLFGQVYDYLQKSGEQWSLLFQMRSREVREDLNAGDLSAARASLANLRGMCVNAKGACVSV